MWGSSSSPTAHACRSSDLLVPQALALPRFRSLPVEPDVRISRSECSWLHSLLELGKSGSLGAMGGSLPVATRPAVSNRLLVMSH